MLLCQLQNLLMAFSKVARDMCVLCATAFAVSKLVGPQAHAQVLIRHQRMPRQGRQLQLCLSDAQKCLGVLTCTAPAFSSNSHFLWYQHAVCCLTQLHDYATSAQVLPNFYLSYTDGVMQAGGAWLVTSITYQSWSGPSVGLSLHCQHSACHTSMSYSWPFF